MGVENSDGSGLDELERLVLGGSFLLGLVEQLGVAYPTAGRGLAEDCVQEAVRSLVIRMNRPPPVRDVRAYLARVAFNTLKRVAPRILQHEVPLEARPDAAHRSAEDEALRDAAVRAVKQEIRTWPNANIREVMLVYIDAIALGEPIEAEEVAELVSPILGEDISPVTVRKWKQRGMNRLREFIERDGWTERRTNIKEKSK
ncbi:sigma-70 family RNA polymerase sigma factor [Mycobacteroides abscessus]|nr:hypothetical protein DDJ88_08235 [Mycobacteroides abscessus]PVA52360.1 hypothetical protein DDJ35_01705 [Mycobacteroides abscessus]RIQ86555.1 sigma-70 family RNA polymerase sigma factor [Mycobacteroides abscessus]RIQ96557.1 sigma-70 family RNA polymerase sigma factor [Mycobacteroides abscessus]RIS06341.1 sigma-70 family RNA polymerase sigma factor [Mycobacteroides abscessus]